MLSGCERESALHWTAVGRPSLLCAGSADSGPRAGDLSNRRAVASLNGVCSARLLWNSRRNFVILNRPSKRGTFGSVLPITLGCIELWNDVQRTDFDAFATRQELTRLENRDAVQLCTSD